MRFLSVCDDSIRLLRPQPLFFSLRRAFVFAARRSLAPAAQLAAAQDPVQIGDQALDRDSIATSREHEIRAALAADDTDLAQSFVELAADRGVAVDPAVARQRQASEEKDDSPPEPPGRFVRPVDRRADRSRESCRHRRRRSFVFGDIRDGAREGTRYLTGQKYDPWNFGSRRRRPRHHGGDLCVAGPGRAGAGRFRWSKPPAGPAGSIRRWPCARRAKR